MCQRVVTKTDLRCQIIFLRTTDGGELRDEFSGVRVPVERGSLGVGALGVGAGADGSSLLALALGTLGT